MAAWDNLHGRDSSSAAGLFDRYAPADAQRPFPDEKEIVRRQENQAFEERQRRTVKVVGHSSTQFGYRGPKLEHQGKTVRLCRDGKRVSSMLTDFLCVLQKPVEFELEDDLDWVSIQIGSEYLHYDQAPRRVNRDPDGKFRLPAGFDLDRDRDPNPAA